MTFETHDEDIGSFFAEMSDVKPIRSDDVAQLHDPCTSLAQKKKLAQKQKSVRETLQNPLSMEGVEPIPIEEFIVFKQPGIQDGVFKKLRLGKYPLENKLSLKGLTLADSRDKVFQTIMYCHEQGIRALLIQHGKGENSQPFPGLKRSYLNHWLRELECVIAFHTAQPMHGGFAGTYVLLKKHPQQKLINREKNRRG